MEEASTTTAADRGPVLEGIGLVRRYGSRTALDDVSLQVERGERVAVIGPNGAGKTTLLSMLGGVLRPDAGEVRSLGTIGWVPQRAAVYGRLTVRENLALFARLERIAEPEAAVERMLERAALADRAADQVDSLSGGMRQRVSVAAGLLCDPTSILLDEPSTALDPIQRDRLWSFVGELADEGVATVFTTHDVREADRQADRVVVLAGGRQLFSGSPAELRAEGGGGDDFEQAFVSFLDSRSSDS